VINKAPIPKQISPPPTTTIPKAGNTNIFEIPITSKTIPATEQARPAAPKPTTNPKIVAKPAITIGKINGTAKIHNMIRTGKFVCADV
jgi:hypothetical protein